MTLFKFYLNNKTRYPFIFLFGCITCGVLIYLHVSPDKWLEAIVAALGVVGGFSGFLYSQHNHQTDTFIQLFMEFNKRYDELNNKLSMIESKVSNTNNPLNDTDKTILCDYFNLCAEEHLFLDAGYIDIKKMGYMAQRHAVLL